MGHAEEEERPLTDPLHRIAARGFLLNLKGLGLGGKR